MKRTLSKTDVALYHYAPDGARVPGPRPEMWGGCSALVGDCTNLEGDCSGLRGYCSELRGDCSGLWGECSGIWGDCSGVRGDCSGVLGDLDGCGLTAADRKTGVDIENLVLEPGE